MSCKQEATLWSLVTCVYFFLKVSALSFVMFLASMKNAGGYCGERLSHWFFSCLRSGCVFWTRGPQSSAHLSTRKGKCARLVLVCWWEVQFLIEVGQALSVWSCSFPFCTKQASCNKAHSRLLVDGSHCVPDSSSAQ